MTNDSLVSIIMPAYNAEEFISESILSVRKQSHQNWELLVIDDASYDQTAEIVNALEAEDERIKLHKLPANQGAGFARNIGIKASKGNFIAFLDADDLWEEQKLEVQLRVMTGENAKVCFSTYDLINEEGRPLSKKVKALKKLTFQRLLKANYIGNLTGIYNAEALGKIYCPLIRKRQDWGLWLLALQKAGAATGIQESLAQYRVRKGSISANKFEMMKYNYLVYREILGFSAAKSAFYMAGFLWEQFLVKNKRTIPSE